LEEMKLPLRFYERRNVIRIARDLLGKVLYTNLGGKLTAGIITETEAYAGVTDRASHAFNNRRTKRTEIMYAAGGVAYVYLCYGMHHLFNVVTNVKGIPHAVLIRSIRPYAGLAEIMKRRGVNLEYRNEKNIKYISGICKGPGKVSQALGIKVAHSGADLQGSKIWIEDNGIIIPKDRILKSPRIGVAYAGTDALLQYRFMVENSEPGLITSSVFNK
jgi:DNA-3-methyladenine glycosylase